MVWEAILEDLPGGKRLCFRYYLYMWYKVNLTDKAKKEKSNIKPENGKKGLCLQQL